MNILITGGYGFIGSHIAERFFKEGHKIYIIDNLSTGNENNVNIKHKFYNLDIKSDKCDEIFKANNFDVTINASAYNESTNFQESLMGFINIQSLCRKYKVKKYVYISSTDVYGEQSDFNINEEYVENPSNKIAKAKLSEENYCLDKYNRSSLDILCLRLSCIYGPRQNHMGENSFLYDIFNKKISTLNIDKNENKDFLYVEDAVDAIYKLTLTNLKGKFNICSGKNIKVKDFITIVNKQDNNKTIKFLDSNNTVLKKYNVDNNKIKHAVRWNIKYSLEEGLKMTFNNFNKEKNVVKDSLNKVSENIFIKTMLPYIENILAFLVIAYIKYKNIQSSNLSDNLFTDITMFYIIIMATVYGMRQGIIASILASSFYSLLFFKVLQGDIATFLYDSQYFTHIIFYILIASVIGYVIDNKSEKIISKDIKYENLHQEYNFTKKLYEETLIVKKQFEKQIRSSEDSFGRLYEITRKLNTLHPEKVFNSAIEVVEETMKLNSVAIYTMDISEKFLRLKSKSNNSNIKTPNSIEIDSSLEFKNVLKKKSIYINKNITKDSPIMLAPVIDNDKVIAIIAIYNIDFNKLTLYTENLFKTTVALISIELIKAYKYEEFKAANKYVYDTKILKPEYFESIVKIKEELKASSGINYTLINIKSPLLSLKDSYEKLSTVLRETDFIGLDKNNELYVLVSNADDSTIEVPLNNINKLNIMTKIVNKEDKLYE